MWFESVRCHPFGPFLDHKMPLKQGMNVVFGPNEVGKSTWAAALTAGLCGIRRGPGKTDKERVFERRHRPWNDGKEWQLTTVVQLAGGRRVRLSQDLAGRVDCNAYELGGGHRDLTRDIENKGTPDGSIWLGLNRRSFRSVAYLRQGEMLNLLTDSGKLDADLQKAAATARTDSTAKDALDRQEQFRRERIGSDRATTKPRCISQARVEKAHTRLRKARQERTEYRELQRRLERKPLAEDENLEAKIWSAVGEWKALPPLHAPDGPSLAQLESELGAAKEEHERLTSTRAETELFATIGAVRVAALAGGAALSVLVGALLSVVGWVGLLAVVIYGSWSFIRERTTGREARRQRLSELTARRQCLDRAIFRREHDDRAHATASRRRRAAEERVLGVAAEVGMEIDDPALAVEQLKSWQQQQRSAQTRLNEQRADLKAIGRTLPDIVVLEEELAAAKAEKQRLLDLDSVLEQTIGFLTAAQERVHRSLAPVLREGVVRWLDQVTGGRYTDCGVEPSTLRVEVRGPERPWREATNLSQGATEQIYLLLRLALAEHLGKRDERCPLILDDPLATSDSSRRKVLLETLLTISEERQVILFTHDDDQRDWAAEHLTQPGHQLFVLSGDELPA